MAFKRAGKKIKRKSEKGQISIMIGIMMMTFILFFAFVINTGMLVNAKINLQNAADLAAYAGAAVQARQLTQISYLNYEMRRQWKKFLFRIYVLGNRAQDSFQDAQNKTGQMIYYPNRTAPVNYGVPTTCIMFNATDNFCHLNVLPKITIPPPTFLDSISDTLRDQLQQIEKIRQNNCKGISLTNLMVNLNWLYNTDPHMTNYSASPDLAQEQINTIRIVQGMMTGLGIVPRELLLKYRINTLASYVNAKTQTSITKSQVDDFLTTADPSLYERTIQAYYSAYYTLGNHTYPSDAITLDELLPNSNSDSAAVLFLKEIHQSFDTYAIVPDLDVADSGGGADCKSVTSPLSVTAKLPVGFYKDPTILTYYALRLKAKAKILFSPFGDIEMKAYSAAQPFGSRIGPALADNSFGFPGAAASVNANLQEIAKYVPNLPVKKNDPETPSASTGWNTMEVMTAMNTALTAYGNGTVVQGPDMERAYATAMAPNPWEANRYNIINDEGQDPFSRNFEAFPRHMAAFWAPIFPPGKDAQSISDQLTADLTELFVGNASSQAGSGGVSTGTASAAAANVLKFVLAGIQTYMGLLRSGDGENQEGMNIVRITDPFHDQDGNPISGDSTLFLSAADVSTYKSSWNSVNDKGFQTAGRVGYSVKFVSFDSLTAHKLTTNGSSVWTNELSQDPEAEGDIPFIKH